MKTATASSVYMYLGRDYIQCNTKGIIIIINNNNTFV